MTKTTNKPTEILHCHRERQLQLSVHRHISQS